MLSFPPLPYVNYFDTSLVATFIFDISSASRVYIISQHRCNWFCATDGLKEPPPSPFTSMRAFVHINSLRKVLRQQGLANLVHGIFVIVISISVTVIFWSIMKGSRFHSRDSISYKCQKAAASGGPAACALRSNSCCCSERKSGLPLLIRPVLWCVTGHFSIFSFLSL